MDPETLKLILFKLNLVVEKIQNLEYKVDLLSKKHKQRQQEENELKSESSSKTNKAKVVYRFLKSCHAPNCGFTWTRDCDSVFPLIFEVMDISTLKNLRLVCKAWNRKVVPALSNVTKLDIRTWEKTHDPEDVPLPVHDIYEMFESPPDDIIFFRNLALSYQCFFYSELQIQLLLREFGINLLSLSLDTPRIEILRHVIAHWCPNLEELNVCITDVTVADGEFQLPANSSFRLKSLKVHPSKGRFLDSSSLTQSLLGIVKCCPDLTNICMADNSMFTDFFVGLAPLVEITKNLREMDLDGLNELNIEDLDFPKVFKLNIRVKHAWVTPLLNKIWKSLEILTLGFPLGNYFSGDDTQDSDTGEDDGDHNLFSGSRKNYPTLSNLRIFKLKGYLTPDSSIRSLECSKMTNLQVLYINLYEGDLETVLLKTALCDPMYSLRKLTLVGSLSCVLSFQIIATLFPNLVTIKLGIARKFVSEDTPDECLRDGLPKLGSLQNFRKLSVFLDCSACENIGEVVSSLKELPGLTDFELGNFDQDRSIVSGLLRGITEANQISRIRLVNIVLLLPESKGLLEELQTRGTTLIVVENIPNLMDL